MPKGPIFRYLGQDVLDGMRLLACPIHIFSFSTNHICWSTDAAVSFWNAESVDELLNRTLTPFSDATMLRLNQYRSSFARGEVRNEGWTFYPKGDPVTAQCRCTGISIDGHPEAMMVEVSALSPQELQIPELRAIEALRHTPLMISLFSETGQVLLRNPAAAACFERFDETQPRGADHLMTMFADGELGRRQVNQALTDGKAQALAVIAAEGSPIHSIQMLLVADPATGNNAFLIAQQDMSETVAVRRQLAASDEALDLILGLNDNAVLVFSISDGRILQANSVAERLLGITPDAGGTVNQVFSNHLDLPIITAELLSGHGSNWQIQLLRDGGQPFGASVFGLRISFHNIDAIVLIAADIDSFYRAASDLEDALDFERNTTEMQRRVLAIASHEFRTPLAIIDSAAQRLERHADDVQPNEIRTSTRRIRSTVNQLIRMIDDTLEHARIERGGHAFKPVLADIGTTIAECCAKFCEQDPELRIELTLPTTPPLLFDHALIARALENLVSNAIKYSETAARIAITAAADSEDVRITVRDYGIGVQKDDRAQIFGEFYRAPNVSGRPGTGLGLTIVRQIISMHGGQIEVVDTEGQGTTFQINLPRPTAAIIAQRDRDNTDAALQHQ